MGKRNPNRVRAGYRAAETRRGMVTQVRDAIDPVLVPLYDRVGAGTGSLDERIRRIEQYAHDHQSEAMAALQEHADARLEQLIAERLAS